MNQISMLLFQKTSYFDMQFLYNGDLRILCFRNNGEIIKLNTFCVRKTTFLISFRFPGYRSEQGIFNFIYISKNTCITPCREDQSVNARGREKDGQVEKNRIEREITERSLNSSKSNLDILRGLSEVFTRETFMKGIGGYDVC